MRNLKRALSLALASVMVISMMVVGAGAASYDEFTDKDEIVNKEAVNVLVELGVIEGKDTGAFDPTGIITRGEMAKIICVVLNKGQNPNLGDVTSNTYTDTVGHWAAPYIEYCTSLGIVAGKGDGTFAPNDTVTASEAAKMLLVALGYNAQYENMIGANWAVATNVLANKNGLYDGLDIMVDEGLTRDNAAQMMYNALDAVVVYYDYAVIPSGDSISAVATAKPYDDNRTLLTDKFGAVKVEGVVVANEFATLGNDSTDDDGVVIGSAQKAEKTRVFVTNGEDQDEYNDNTTYTFTVSSGVEALGRSVSLYVKPSTTSEKSTVIGSVIVSEENVVVTDTSGDSINDVLDDNDLDAATGMKVYANYGKELTSVSGILTDADNGSTDGTNVRAGVEKIIIDNDNDGEADYVLLNTYELGKVTKYSTKDDGSITVAAGTTFKSSDSADVVGFDDVAKDDYVLAAWIGGKLYVEKAETVAGDLTAYKTNSSLTVDDTKYDISRVAYYTGAGDLQAAKSYGSSTTLKMAATFYLDKAGRIIAVGDADESAYNYALVWGTEDASDISYGKVKVTLQDGTTTTYAINSKSALDADAVDAGDIVSYSLTSDNEIKMSDPVTYTGTDGTFSKGKTTVAITEGTDSGENLYTSANTAFFYVTMDGGKVSSVDVYTGYANAPTVDSADGVVVAENTSGKIVAVAFTGSDATAQAEDHVFIYKTGSTTDEYIEAYAYVNGKDENEIINVSDFPGLSGDLNDLVVDKLYTYSVNSDGYYELDTVPSGASFSGVVANSPKTTIVVGGTEYKLTDETVVIDNVGNPSTPDAVLNGAVSKGDTVMGIKNSDGEVLMLVINYYGDDTMKDASASDIEAALAENGTVYVSGEMTGTINVAADQTLVLTDAIDGTVTFAATSTGTVVFDDAVVDGTVTVTGDAEIRNMVSVNGTLDLDGATVEIATGAGANVADGATLKFNSIDSSSVIDGAFTVKANAAGGTDYSFGEVTLLGDLKVAAKDVLVLSADSVLTVGEHTLTVTGTVDAANGAKIVTVAGSTVTGIDETITGEGEWVCTDGTWAAAEE